MKKLLLFLLPFLLLAGCGDDIKQVDTPPVQDSTYRWLVGTIPISELENRSRDEDYNQCEAGKCIKNTATLEDLKWLCKHGAFCWK